MSTEQASFILRPARVGDRNRLRAMQALSLRALACEFYSPAEIESFLAYVGTVDEHLLAEGTYHLIEVGGEVVASGGWSQFRANFSRNAEPAADLSAARTRSVFVHPDWTRHGFGTRLMRRAEAEAFGAGFNEMELNAMLSGVGFYATLGYQRVRDIAVSMPEGVVFRGVTMRKALSQEVARAPASSGTVEHRLTGRRCGVAA